jgi:hypothetical protein
MARRARATLRCLSRSARDSAARGGNPGDARTNHQQNGKTQPTAARGRTAGVVDRLNLAYSLAAEHELTAVEAALLAYVAFRDGGAGCTAHRDTIRAELRFGVNALDAARRELKRLGLISVQQRRHATAVLRFRDSMAGVESRPDRDSMAGVEARLHGRGGSKNQKKNQNRPTRERAAGDGGEMGTKIADRLSREFGTPVDVERVHRAVAKYGERAAKNAWLSILDEWRSGKLKDKPTSPAGLLDFRLREGMAA